MSTIPSLHTLRADTVGSLLRPEALKRAYAELDAGALSAEEVERIADDAIREVVVEQEAHGLPVISDGEFRRRAWMQSFAAVSGFSSGELAPVQQSRVVSTAPGDGPGTERMERVRDAVLSPMALVDNRPRREFEFTQALTDRPVKGTLVNPDRVVQSFDAAGSTAVYPDADAFCDDVVRIGREIIAGLVEAGCRYVQVDAPGYMMYTDEGMLAAMRERGEDPERNLQRAIDAENALIAGHDDGVTFGLHICRGNRSSRSHLTGSYDAFAERMFGSLHYDRLLLEYDNERAGGFEPLRRVPSGTVVVLGLISTKTSQLESRDELLRRIEQAAAFLPIEQLAISPQCGFASVMEGNLLSADEQWAKLDLMLEVAREVWG